MEEEIYLQGWVAFFEATIWSSLGWKLVLGCSSHQSTAHKWLIIVTLDNTMYKFANKSLIIQFKNQVHLKPLLTISMLMVATTFAEQQWPHLSSAFVIPVIIQMATAASIWSRDLHALCFSLAVPRFFRRFWRYCASFLGLLRQPSPISRQSLRLQSNKVALFHCELSAAGQVELAPSQELWTFSRQPTDCLLQSTFRMCSFGYDESTVHILKISWWFLSSPSLLCFLLGLVCFHCDAWVSFQYTRALSH